MSAGLTDSDTMFSVRETPWHGLGAVLDRPPATVGEAIEAWVSAGASQSGAWRSTAVLTCPMCCVIGASLVITPLSGKTTMRCLASSASATGSCRITKRCVRRPAARQLIGFEMAGGLHGGRRVWVLATLPDHVEFGGDGVRPYVLLMNSHDGSTAVSLPPPRFAWSAERLNLGLTNARQKFSIRHTEAVRSASTRLAESSVCSINYYEQFKRLGDRLAFGALRRTPARAVLTSSTRTARATR